jgi:hypothetical protein
MGRGTPPHRWGPTLFFRKIVGIELIEGPMHGYIHSSTQTVAAEPLNLLLGLFCCHACLERLGYVSGPTGMSPWLAG